MANLTIDALVQLAQQGGWTGSDILIAAAIAMAESSGNPDAVHQNTNGTTDYGLWQINTVHDSDSWGGPGWAEACKGNPILCAQRAYEVYRQQGWDAWTTYKSGAYKKYLIAGTPSTPPAPSGTPVPTTGSDSSQSTTQTPSSGAQQLAFIIDLLQLMQRYNIVAKE